MTVTKKTLLLVFNNILNTSYITSHNKYILQKLTFYRIYLHNILNNDVRIYYFHVIYTLFSFRLTSQ